MEYNEVKNIGSQIKVIFRDAGHILGSAIIEIEISENNDTTKLIFSGDLGQSNQPIIKDPEYINNCDYLFIESTYGLRKREEFNKEILLTQAINETIDRGGSCIIPAFAVGRTQAMLYYLAKLTKAKKIPTIPIYLDSPLGIAATDILRHHPEVFDEEMSKIRIEQLISQSKIELKYARTVDESKTINELLQPKIIISSSGMADGGRILHHLKHNLWKEENSILFMGYQAEGTLGRRILEGAKKVKIMGEEIAVNAKVYNYEGFSAHADREELLDWLKHLQTIPKNVFIMHGEQQVALKFAEDVKILLGYETYALKYGDIVTITKEKWEVRPNNIIGPLSAQLQNLLGLIEEDYADLRNRIQFIVNREPRKTNSIFQRLEKAHKMLRKLVYKI